MKNRLSLILAVALISLAGWTVQAKLQKNTAAKQIWDYEEVELDTNSYSAPRLNEFGKQGWELVGVTSNCPSSHDSTIRCTYKAYLKRPR